MKWIFAPLLPLAALFVALLIPPAESQLPQVTVVGPVTTGDCTSFSSTLQLKDSGFACSGGGATALQFIGTSTGGGSASAFLTNAAFGIDVASAGVDQKWWDIVGSSSPSLLFRTVNDAQSSSTVWMQVNRGTGTAITNVTFSPQLIGNGGLATTASNSAEMLWSATGSGTDQKQWDCAPFTTPQFQCRAVNDVFNSTTTWLSVARGTGTAINNIQLGNGTAFAQVTGAGGHMGFTGGTAPTANACAGFALTTGSQDSAGRVSFTSAGSCVINFGTAYTNAPFCSVTPGSAASTVQITTTTTGLAATFGTAQTSMFWTCQGI